MFRNFIKIAINNLIRSKLYSFINIFGLAVGLSSVILIGLFVIDETSFDRQYKDADQLYRISRDFFPFEETQEMYLATNAPQVAQLLKSDFADVEETARLFPSRGMLSRRENNTRFFEDEMRFVDAAFFELFDFNWLQGDSKTALEAPTALVLTESAARRYFGDEQAVGQLLYLENFVPMPVTGVIADLPNNTHLSGNVFGNLEGMFAGVFGDEARTNWELNSFHTYARVAPGTDIDALNAQFPDFLNRHQQADASERNGLTATSVTDIHLFSNREGEISQQGNVSTVITLTAIALGILFIACFNFMNLSTARSELRGKEVGVRKTIGSNRSQLILQFLGESFTLTLLATLLAVVLVETILPAFNGFTGKDLALNIFSDIRTVFLLVSLVLIVGGFAGSYPAFYLSSFKPAQVLRSKVRVSKADIMFRNLLVVLQFSISIILVVATIVVFLQNEFSRNFDIGFNKAQMVVLQGSPSQGLGFGATWETLKQELLRNPDISSVTASGVVPGAQNLNTLGVIAEGRTDARDLTAMMVDYNFFETYGIDVLAGRTYSKDFPNDVFNRPGENATERDTGIILNAAAVRALGWTQETAIDKTLDIVDNEGTSNPGRVIGVVPDSNFESVRYNVKPMIFILVSDSVVDVSTTFDILPTLYFASVDISGRNRNDTLAYIDRVWNEVIPNFPIARSFLGTRFDALYQDDRRLGQLFSQFATLAIMIACLGLYGLASFNTQRRSKEIGIRKVMGSSVWGIVVLLTNDFSKLVLISNVIAWPVAYFAMNSWLENFAYRIDLTLMTFIGSGLIALCIAWVTVGGTAARAASQKPVLALRYE